MKTLRRIRLIILTILFLTGVLSHGIVHAGQDSVRAFSWEGLSLSMTPDQMVNALEGDGYTQLRVTEGKKRISFYQRKTETGSNKVQIIEKNGALIKLNYSEMRAGGKKNFLSPEVANSTLSSIKSKLGIDDSFCTSGVKGGGKCSGRPGSATHDNSFSVNVKPRGLKITLTSNPIAQAIIESNKEMTEGLASAYACFGTTDIASVKDVYDCIQSSSRILSKMQQGRGRKQNGVNLESPVISCSNLTNFYKRALSYDSTDSAPISGRRGGVSPAGSSADSNDIDASQIPDCKTFAAVIERALGRPPYWANCVNPTDDGDSIQACIEGYNPSLVNGIRFFLPSCERLQRSYKVSVIAGQPKSKGYNVSVPNCERLTSLAKQWRPEIHEDLKPCEAYDPDKTAEHVMTCLAPERVYIGLYNCAQVQIKYRQYVNMANGYLPDDYYALPCDQAEPLLAKAEDLREKRRKEAEEFARKMAERKKLVLEARKQEIQDMKDRMAKKYADTPEYIASRTSALEKQIKSTGKIPKDCNGYYCPPTLEEIRLAMMRHQSQKLGLKIINGHMMYGKMASVATMFMMMGGQQGKGMIGYELHYKGTTLIYKCKLDSGAYDCYFRLPFKTKFDELTSMYMDGLTSGLPVNLNYMVHNMIGNAMAVEEYSFLFRIDNGGLWRANPTVQQNMKDIQKKIDAIDTGHHH